MSFLFAYGKINWFKPSLFAAMIFSLKPPIGKTFPFRDISPVIPKFWGIGFFRARLIIEVVIAIPAEGPSFYVAPSGKWICKLLLERFSTATYISWSSWESLHKKFLAKVRAIVELSFITDPSWPVIVRLLKTPFPFYFDSDESSLPLSLHDASIYIISPPCELYASPITTPGGSFLYILAEW